LNRKSTITAIEYYLPEKIETNEELSKENPDWRVDEIYAKSGIYSRHLSSSHETAGDLAFYAVEKLLNSSNIDKSKIDFLLLCTQSPDYFLPPTACILQERLELPKSVGALDFNMGCSGFVYGLAIAKGLVESGIANNVLLCNSDTYTKYIHKRDRTVRALFGDGASATLITSSEDETNVIYEFDFGTDGSGAKHLIVPAGGLKTPHSSETAKEIADENGCIRSLDNLFMNGASIFSFAINTVPRSIQSLLNKCSLKIEDINFFVFHQASLFMLNHLIKKLGINPDKAPIFLENVGNTVSASIPIVLKEIDSSGKLKKGDKLVLCGFGVGLSWGTCFVQWNGLR
jgi:3-oxoacyl-[acyl-carrier-protein] synthase-3